MALALILTTVINKVEYTTTVATSIVIIIYFITGHNRIVTEMFPADKWLVNYIPNSLITRTIIWHLVDMDYSSPYNPMTPPNMPHTPKFLLVLVGYAIFMTFVAVILMKKVVYEGDLGE